MGKRGNPGYGKMENIRENVDKFSPVFWRLMEEFSQSKSKDDRRFFITEFNKIQAKMIPQQLTGPDDGPVQVEWLSPSITGLVSGPKPSTPHVHAG